MKLKEAVDLLKSKGVRQQVYAVNAVAANDAIVIYQESPFHWTVFYTERGLRIDEKTYNSEDQACQDFIDRAVSAEEEMRAYEVRRNSRGI
ncbi:hypothetical protein [Propionibacterium australiense]|uniref:hypothetical protein n=1 Tax=Propionibacterium australiense TaxID=119981 RepID=UPI000F82807C|nr:hypothetical protein [Propionibacterium australiense]